MESQIDFQGTGKTIHSDIPAVTHIDYSARIQTVDHKTNPRFWCLLKAFKDLTGYGVLVNTSFNVRGEPIVSSLEDAYLCFQSTEIDYLLLENYLISKKSLPIMKREHEVNFELD